MNKTASRPRSISGALRRLPPPPSRFFSFGAIAIVAFGLACSPARGASDSSASGEQALARARADLANPGRRAAAERALLRLAEDRNETLRVKARVALSAFRRQAGQPKEAFALVNAYADLQPDNLALPRLHGYLETALCQIALNQPLTGFKMLDYANERAGGLPAVLTRVALSRAMEAAPDLNKAMDYMKDALGYGDRYFQRKTIKTSESDAGELEPAKPDSAEWPQVRADLLARIRRLERQQRIAKWGLDYVLYLEAQEARNAAYPLALDFTNVRRIFPRAETNSPPPGVNYRKSMETYDLIIRSYPQSVFAEAARVYRWICVAKLGRSDEALEGLDVFCRQNPNGLYLGDALKLLGDLWLQDRWEAAKAEVYYQKTVEWCHNARSLTESARLFALPEKCREPATPPQAWQIMDDAGIIAYIDNPPGAVVNRLTAPWHLNRLEEDAEFALGFARSAANDWPGALTHFQRALELDPILQMAEKNRYYNTFLRLRYSCDKKAYVGGKEENIGLQGQSRLAMMWADFIYMRMYFQQAESLYTRLYRAAGEQRDGNIAARAGLGLILAAMQQKNMDSARRISEEVLKRWPHAPATPYVCFLRGDAYGPGENYAYTEALACYRETYTRYPRSRWAEWARFQEIFKGIAYWNLEERRDWIANFKRDYPNSEYLPMLDENTRLLEGWARRFGSGVKKAGNVAAGKKVEKGVGGE